MPVKLPSYIIIPLIFLMGLRQNRATSFTTLQGEPIMQPSMRCQCALTLLMTNPVPKQRVYAYCMLFACVFDTVCFRHHRAEGLQLRAKPTLFFLRFRLFAVVKGTTHCETLLFRRLAVASPRMCLGNTPCIGLGHIRMHPPGPKRWGCGGVARQQ